MRPGQRLSDALKFLSYTGEPSLSTVPMTSSFAFISIRQRRESNKVEEVEDPPISPGQGDSFSVFALCALLPIMLPWRVRRLLPCNLIRRPA